jgi:hypothetical protein
VVAKLETLDGVEMMGKSRKDGKRLGFYAGVAG